MIPTLRDLAAGLTVLGFLLILPAVASAHSQPRASGVSQDCRRVIMNNCARYSRCAWADIQGIRLMTRMP